MAQPRVLGTTKNKDDRLKNHKGLRDNQELIYNNRYYLYSNSIEIDDLKKRKPILIMEEMILKLEYIKIMSF